MLWIVWALMLLSHGAFARWVQNSRGYAKVAVIGDLMLVAIALVTIDQLQGMTFLDYLRIGVFFIAFGTAGRQLMVSVLAVDRRVAP
jgi:hypothetical protein